MKGVAIGCFLQMSQELKGANVAIVLCGGNIDSKKFSKIINN